MFNFSRFTQLVQWTWQRSPAWYLFIHFGACLFVALFVHFIIGDFSSLFGTGGKIVKPSTLFYTFVYANCLSMIPVAAHFVSRHFRDNRQTTDYLTIPVSSTERYLTLFLAVFVAFPLIAYLSSLLFFVVAKTLTSGVNWPHWHWMSGVFSRALFPYFIGAVFCFALGLLRPRQTVLWGLGILAGVAALVGIFAQLFLGGQSQHFSPTESLPTSTSNLFGAILDGDQKLQFSGGDGISDNLPILFTSLGIAVLLFFISAWRSLNAKEV